MTDNLTSFEQKAWTKKAKVSEYPITFPSGRNNIALALFKDLVYVFGGLSNSEMNDVWVYNLSKHYETIINHRIGFYQNIYTDSCHH